MRVGACLSWEHAYLLKEAGGDFIELPLAKVAQLEESHFEEVSQSLFLPAEVFNIFLPPSLRIVGEYVDWKMVEKYLQIAFTRAQQLGGKVIVFGSGGARRVPENFPKRKAEEQILLFLSLASDIAVDKSFTIAVEHLNSSETNTINSFEEALQLVEKLGRDNVGVLADIYHLLKEGEDLEVIRKAGEKLLHIHLSDPERNPPLKGEKVVKDFLLLLKEMGYKNRISVECRWSDLGKELPKVIQTLKNQWRCAYEHSFP